MHEVRRHGAQTGRDRSSARHLRALLAAVRSQDEPQVLGHVEGVRGGARQ